MLLWNLVAMPRGTPTAVKKALADATKAVMGTPAMAATLAEQGIFANLHIADAAASIPSNRTQQIEDLRLRLGAGRLA